MAKSRRSRDDWIAAALEVLEAEGVEAVRVEPLARRLAVTKGSFYWHFPNRGALLEGVLDAWEKLGTDAIIAAVSAEERSPADALRALWARTLESSSRMRGELAIRDLAQRDAAVRERVRRVDDRRMAFLRRLFRAHGCAPKVAEARSLLLYSLLIGNVLIEARHGRLSRARVLDQAVEELLA